MDSVLAGSIDPLYMYVLAIGYYCINYLLKNHTRVLCMAGKTENKEYKFDDIPCTLKTTGHFKFSHALCLEQIFQKGNYHITYMHLQLERHFFPLQPEFVCESSQNFCTHNYIADTAI